MHKGKSPDIRIQKKIFGQVRRAVQDYNMIEDGDRIAVCVSGGKDSITLLIALSNLQRFYPRKFELEAITLTLGIGAPDFSNIDNLCKNLGINYTIEDTLIGKIVFEVLKEKNPCSLCANMRHGALHNAAKKLNCNKIALGHNRDDVIETFMLSLFYEGQINTFSPVTYLSRKDIFVIRPLIYSEAKDIKGFIKSKGIRTVPSLCYINNAEGSTYVEDSANVKNSANFEGGVSVKSNVENDANNIENNVKNIVTKRSIIRNYLLELQKDAYDEHDIHDVHDIHNAHVAHDASMIKDNIFGAIKRSDINGWNSCNGLNERR